MPAALDIEVHPAANIFPMEDEAALQELSEDIKTNGLLFPCIKVPDGRLLDGRNRYRACKMAGVAPRFETYVGNDPVSFVWSANAARRQLTPSQKAMAAAAMANLRLGTNRYEEKVDAPGGASKTLSDAAREVGTARRSVQRAAAVRREAEPELVEAVEKGKLTVRKAEKVAKAKPAVQRKIAAAPDPEKAAAEELDQEGCSDGPEIDPFHNAQHFDDALTALATVTKHANALTGSDKTPAPIPGGELLGHYRQELDAHCKNAREVLKSTKPHKTCPYCIGKKGECKVCKGNRWVTRQVFEDAPVEMRDKVEAKKK